MKTRKVYSYVVKDMLESGVNPSLLITNRLVIEELNLELGIYNSIEIASKPKPKVRPRRAFVQPKTVVKPSISYHRTVIINSDGTVSMEFEEWDYK